MAMRARDIIKWLESLDPNTPIGIDEGWHLLIGCVPGAKSYFEEWLEVGGVPEEWERDL